MSRLGPFLLSLLAVVLCSQCASFRHRVAATEEVPRQSPSAEHLDVGHVSFVRGAESWVLISLDPGVKLPQAARLQAKSDSGEISQLKLTAQKAAGYHAAEILSGAPRHGDLVIMTYPKGDGTDPEEQIRLDDIPPLLRRRPPLADYQDGLPSSDPDTSTPDEDPPTPSPTRVLIDQPIQFRTKGIEPRPPIKESDRLRLPDWTPPDEDAFMQELPQS